MPGLGAAEAGTRAFDALIAHQPAGVNRTMWLFYSGLTESELRRGIDWLRDLFGEDRLFVRLRIGRENIYRIPSSDRDWREDLLRYLKGQITRAKRHFNRCTDAAEKFPSTENDFQLEMARRQLFDLQRAYDEMLERGKNEAA